MIYDCLFYFNGRSRKGSDAPKSISSLILSKFQSTLPRGERLRSGTRCRICYDFNPRSHEGSDYGRIKKKPYGGISIHAPTRGATPCRQKKSSMQIFQSTLPRGERRLFLVFDLFQRKFQSTLPRGERLMLSVFRSKALGISIHAPTRGATCSGHKIFYTGSKFQSTLPRGERPGQKQQY